MNGILLTTLRIFDSYSFSYFDSNYSSYSIAKECEIKFLMIGTCIVFGKVSELQN